MIPSNNSRPSVERSCRLDVGTCCHWSLVRSSLEYCDWAGAVLSVHNWTLVDTIGSRESSEWSIGNRHVDDGHDTLKSHGVFHAEPLNPQMGNTQ